MSLCRVAALAPVFVALACTSVPRTEASADSGELPRAAPGVLYAIGAGLGDTVQPYQLDEDEVREVARGMGDAALGKPTAAQRTEAIAAKMREFHQARLEELARREEHAGAFLLEQATHEPGAVKTETGMVLRILEPGSGPKPTIFDLVSVNYRGTLRDGSVFSSNEGAPPEKSQLGATTRCWQEALGAVAAGARVHVVCPPSMAYGPGGSYGMVPGGAVLSYDLELVAIERKPPPPNWNPEWDVKPQPPIGAPR